MIKEEAPDAIREGEIKNHFGRKVAIVSFSSLTLSGSHLTLHRMRELYIPVHTYLPL